MTGTVLKVSGDSDQYSRLGHPNIILKIKFTAFTTKCSKITTAKFTTAKLITKISITDFPIKCHSYFISNTKSDSRSIKELKIKCIASKILGANIEYFMTSSKKCFLK